MLHGKQRRAHRQRIEALQRNAFRASPDRIDGQALE
jgi:hypothetical protein